MRRIMGLAIICALGGCTMPRVAGFEAFAPQGEAIDIAGIGLGRSGDFTLGTDGSGGTFRRSNDETSRTSGVFGVTETVSRRHGRTRFTAQGPSVRGRLAGDCGFDRGQRSVAEGGLEVATATVPLACNCTFTRNGVVVGDMRLDASFGRSRSIADTRDGEVRLGATRLTLHSVHGLAGTALPVSDAVGYRMVGPQGQVAMLDRNDWQRVRLILPRDPDQREAALAAALALAFFWDPGDVD